ncbi:hypothetical protein M2132_002292 [Dysgonomonas sp. PH5-45]|uniref:DUF3316 domain-containing protein n=1 Tax=unclassified Dysgonomonas TaxID=2630389 RepID=UPI0024748B44|nr:MULTISPECIES: DUF3316 domain-containing protein [unclassified Dysgonomonas]MDH6355941.1 hypothetical protein [Dysgonomonas sp. PH5-45]MDH6388836.1 hypothetical protein [Dysgonomonas sp. PH5-37]
MTKRVKKTIFLTLACCLLHLTALGQEDTVFISKPATNTATLIGVGNSNLYDTYLSILKYKGTSFHLMNERMRQTTWFDGKFTKQQTINLEFAFAENPYGNVNEYWAMLDYSLGGHYNFYKTNKLRLSAGGLWNTAIGVLYNERNSNNPATARAYSNLQLSAIAFYKWNAFTFRWQIDTPIAGILFSPQYGQSYYEISLGNTVNVVNFASLHNQRALRNYISVDVPINKVSLRFGYLGSFYQTKVHGIQTHTYSNSFMIGIVSESINLSGNGIKKSRVKSSFYD